MESLGQNIQNFRDIRHIKFSFIFPSESGLIESHLVSLWGNSSAAGLDMREQAKREASTLISSRGGRDCRTEIGWLSFSLPAFILARFSQKRMPVALRPGFIWSQYRRLFLTLWEVLKGSHTAVVRRSSDGGFTSSNRILYEGFIWSLSCALDSLQVYENSSRHSYKHYCLTGQ